MLFEGGTKNNASAHGVAKLSLIIVTYNAAKTLQACLDSIYRQTYPNIEVVIIDGASKDDTVKIIQQNESHIAYWKSEQDKGVYDAMNKALKHITGKWVYFLGADDELLDDFSVMANELKDPHSIYYGSVMCNGRKFAGLVSDYTIAKFGIYHQAIIYPVAVFKKFVYDDKYIIHADHVLNMKCAKDRSFTFVFKDHIIAEFNHTGLSSNFIDEVFEKDQAGLVFKNFNLTVWMRFMFWRFKKKYFRKPEIILPPIKYPDTPDKD